MNSLNQRRSDAFGRLIQFDEDYPLQPPVDRATELFTELDGINTALLARAADQATGRTGFRGGSDLRQHLVAALLADMRPINKIARGLDKIAFPAIRAQFRMPRSYGVASVLAAARTFIANATGQAQVFTSRGLPATFLADLTGLVADVEAAIQPKNTGLLKQVSGTAGIEVLGRRGVAILRELDGIINAALKGNEVLLAAWNVAKHIERRNPGPKSAPAPAPGPPGS